MVGEWPLSSGLCVGKQISWKIRHEGSKISLTLDSQSNLQPVKELYIKEKTLI